MRTLKKYYLSRRNGSDGIFYVEFKDKLTGKKMTAKSTRTRNRQEAEAQAAEWYYNPNSEFNVSQKQKAQEHFRQYLQSSLLSEQDLNRIFSEVFGSMALTAVRNYSGAKSTMRVKHGSKYPEIQEVLNRINSLTFRDYIFLFLDYEKSPYIRQLKRTGKKPPSSVRFKKNLGSFKRYEMLLPNTLLSDIQIDEIDDCLTDIKVIGGLKDSSIGQLRAAIVQALSFAHSNGIMERLISGAMIKKFSRKNEEKAIFSQDEYKKLFESGINPFGQRL